MVDRIGKPISQRQLRVGEMIKQSLSMIFIKNEAKVPNLETNTITVTEVQMSQDLKIAKAYVMPLGGKNADEVVKLLKEYSFLIRKILSKKVFMKFLPKLLFRKDESFRVCGKNRKLNKTNKQIRKRKHEQQGKRISNS
jgi:ribosome-binding factor A